MGLAKKSLTIVTAHLMQQVQLVLGLNSLCRDLQTKALSETDHRADNSRIAFVRFQIQDETPVYFDVI